jgi:hypothetical protein
MSSGFFDFDASSGFELHLDCPSRSECDTARRLRQGRGDPAPIWGTLLHLWCAAVIEKAFHSNVNAVSARLLSRDSYGCVE